MIAMAYPEEKPCSHFWTKDRAICEVDRFNNGVLEFLLDCLIVLKNFNKSLPALASEKERFLALAVVEIEPSLQRDEILRIHPHQGWHSVNIPAVLDVSTFQRSEERRVGKECRSR